MNTVLAKFTDHSCEYICPICGDNVYWKATTSVRKGICLSHESSYNHNYCSNPSNCDKCKAESKCDLVYLISASSPIAILAQRFE